MRIKVNHMRAMIVAIMLPLLNVLAQDIIPPSPNAASLGMYADYPVSKYSGVPNIDIPLYHIKVNDYTLPISVSYHASGIKVGQEASWVGLGWALNAGGTITRQVRGEEDFDRWFDDPPLPDENDNEAIADYFTYYMDPTLAPVLEKDGESDIYYFNFAGQSGKFVMTKTGKAIVIDPKTELKIDNINELQWEITDHNGVIYRFQQYERTQAFVSSGTYPDEFTWPTEEQVPYVSSWLLSEIELPSKEKITFNYTNLGSKTKSFISISNDKRDLVGYSVAAIGEQIEWEESKLYDGSGDELCNFNYAKDVYNHSASIVTRELYLSGISWPSGSIEIKTAGRDDLDYQDVTPQRLDSLKVYNGDKEIKTYAFSYSYFNDDRINDPFKHLYLRLKLDSITQLDSTGISLPPYEFAYNNTPLPEKTSTSTDFWGYYNGQSNTDFYDQKKYVPEYKVTVNLDEFGWNETSKYAVMTRKAHNFDQKQLPGANKESHPQFSKAAILEKIKYPTRGVTELFYEPNSYYNLEEEYRQELITESTLACKGSSCNKHEIQNPGPTDVTEFYLEEETNVSIGYYSSNFSENCDNFAYPYGATFNEDTPFCYLDRIDANGNFLSRPHVFKYGNFSNENNCSEIGYPNFSYPNFNITLDAGWYRITVDPFDATDFPFESLDGEVIITYYKNTTERIFDKIGGGLRIAKIKNLATERIFNYEQDVVIDNTPMTVSSGRLLSKPNSIYMEQRYGYCNVLNDPRSEETQENSFSYYAFALLNRSSNSVFPLAGFKSGNSIGYDKVTETIIGNEGETSVLEQRFYNTAEEQTLPFFPNNPKFNNGLLRLEKHFADGTLIKEKEFLYDSVSLQSVRGMKYTRDILGFYSVDSEWWHPYQTIETNYDQNGQNPLTITTDLEYANSDHKLLTRSTQNNSSGKTISQSYTYPSDSDSGAPAEMYDETNSHYKHMLSSLIEEKISVNGVAVSSTRSDYIYDTNKDMVLLDNHMIYPKGTNEGYSVDYEYNETGRLIEQTREHAPSTYYVWGYSSQYPIAKLENFENSRITVQLQGFIDAAILASESDDDRTRDYIDNEGALRRALDDLRGALPDDVMMTSYTYDPLIGVTSVTDTKGYTTYYEYDNFNRLKEVRDANGNLVSDHEYHYKN